MASEWRQVPIGDLVEIFDGPHATPAKTKEGPIFLGISNIAQGRLDLSEVERLSEEDYVRWTRRVMPAGGDVVFSYETRLGEAAIIPRGLRCCLGRRMGLLRPKPGKVDARFLLYAFLGPQFQETLRSRTIPGSTVDRIPLLEMPSFPFGAPEDICEQRAIAHILGTLDDKIELSRRTNETLEAMARALFKAWFVDFLPVRAKMEGRWKRGRSLPGLPAHLYDLFPSRLVGSELGEIPGDWGLLGLGGVIELAYGKGLKEQSRRFGPVPVYGSNGQVGWHDEALVKGPGVVVGRKGNPGTVTWVPNDFYPIDTTFYVIPKSEIKSMRYLFCALSNLDLPLLGADSAVPGLNRSIAYASKALVPPQVVVQNFDSVSAALLARVHANEIESSTLAALRDALLPKLISGEIRVNDVEKFASGAA